MDELPVIPPGLDPACVDVLRSIVRAPRAWVVESRLDAEAVDGLVRSGYLERWVLPAGSDQEGPLVVLTVWGAWRLQVELHEHCHLVDNPAYDPDGEHEPQRDRRIVVEEPRWDEAGTEPPPVHVHKPWGFCELPHPEWLAAAPEPPIAERPRGKVPALDPISGEPLLLFGSVPVYVDPRIGRRNKVDDRNARKPKQRQGNRKIKLTPAPQ